MTDSTKVFVNRSDNYNETDWVTVNEWQDISTAPKDGTHILVWMSEKNLGSHIQTMRTGKVPLIGSIFAWDAAGKPTHWQPLPKPPVSEE